jgi:UPF0271 protein
MSQPLRTDLNGDVGESFGAWRLGHDTAVMPCLTSANIACGFHAGDPDVMRRTVALARRHGVAIGAHPGFADLQGFGRREVRIASAELENLVLYQVGALSAVAAAEGARLSHVKPHGALYNMAAREPQLADAIARAVATVGERLILVGLAGSELIRAGDRAGLPTASEVFADRGYRRDGTLLPRGEAGAVIEDPATAAARAVQMVQQGTITAQDGHVIAVKADTICVHGDTPDAAAMARAIRSALEAAGIQVARLGTSS